MRYCDKRGDDDSFNWYAAMISGKDIPEKVEVLAFPAYDDFVTSKEFEIYWMRDLYSKT